MSEKWERTKWPGIYRDANNPDSYRVRVYDPRTKSYRQPRARSLTEAKDLHAKLSAEVRRVDGAARRRRPPTVREFGEQWRVRQPHGDGTAVDLERSLRIHLYGDGRDGPGWGDYPVTDFAQSHAEDFLNYLRASDLASSTQGKIDSHVRMLFEAVVGENLRDFSPFAKVKRIRVPADEQRRTREYEPTLAEALALAETARRERRLEVWAFIRAAAGTGLRSGELCGFAAEEVDYPQPTRIDLVQQLQYGKVRALGGAAVHYLAPPKSGSGKRPSGAPLALRGRVVPIAPWVSDTLALLTAAREPLRVTLPWVVDGKVKGTRTTTLLWSARYGYPPPPLQEAVIARAVRALAERTGLTPPPADPDGVQLRVTPHTLRRVFHTLLDEAGGIPLRARDYVTGHASQGMTLGVYTGVSEEGLDKIRTAVQAAYDTAWPGVLEQLAAADKDQPPAGYAGG